MCIWNVISNGVIEKGGGERGKQPFPPHLPLLPFETTLSWAAASTFPASLEAMHWYTPASLDTRPRILRLVPCTI